jgi:hypothetical protein
MMKINHVKYQILLMFMISKNSEKKLLIWLSIFEILL